MVKIVGCTGQSLGYSLCFFLLHHGVFVNSEVMKSLKGGRTIYFLVNRVHFLEASL